MPEMPKSCPVCRADRVEHHQPTDKMYEWAKYECGAEIVRMEKGVLDANEQCGARSLDDAVRKLNAA